MLNTISRSSFAEANVSKADLATIPDDLLPIPECAKAIGRPYTSLYTQMRKGNVTVHFIADDTQAKVSLSEVKTLFETVKKRFSAPSFRIVRHDAESVEAQPEKSDLFA